jgi:formamidopyrimidine-DNA glycosylase
MPELPEVETIRRALLAHLPGRTIAAVEIFAPKLREPLAPLRSAGLDGRRIVAVRRRARYLLIDLDDGRLILAHLGMSGVIRIEGPDVPRRKHEHVFIHLSDGMIFRFECTRRFSILKVCAPVSPGGDPPELAKLGVEPFDAGFTAEYLFERAQGRKGCVKNFLMDNAVVVGVGNIYAAESLFAAKLSPLRPAGQVTLDEFAALAAAVRRILASAIAAGGTSISDYKSVDGSEGKFEQELQMYGRAGQPCPVCGAAIAMRRLGGRSSCFCPVCQQ